MKPLRPILRDNPNERVRALLSSAQLDVSPSGWSQRALLAIAATPIIDMTGLTTADAGASIAPEAGAGVAKAIAIKWAAIGAIAGGALSATMMHVVDTRSEPSAVVATQSHRQVTTNAPREPVGTPPGARESSSEPPVVPVPAAEAQHSADKSRAKVTGGSSLANDSNVLLADERPSLTGPTAKQKPEPQPAPIATSETTEEATPAPSLADEVRSLNRIRQVSIERGARVALEQLDRHERQYPTPSLGIEAVVLRIDLLWSAGQKPSARVLARRFLAAHPNCPHTKHVQALLDRDGSPEPRGHASPTEETK